MPVIYETEEDKYYDKEELKIFKKGSQSGIESRGSGIFLPGTKYGSGLYLPTRERQEGEGIIEAILSAGKSVIEGIANNSSTIGQVASSIGSAGAAIGSIASAAKNVSDAVKSIRESKQAYNENSEDSEVDPISKKNKEFKELRLKKEAERKGTGFKVT